MRLGWFCLLLPLLASGRTVAMEYFVSPQGNDAWSGKLAAPAAGDGPWRSLSRAAAEAKPGDVIRIREGLYRETLVPLRDGEPDQPITYQAYGDEQPVITGADAITEWRPGEKGVWLAKMGWDLKDGNQLFAGGQPLTEARWPNSASLFQPERASVASGTETSITDPNLPDGDWTGALLWLASGSQWICQSKIVTKHDAAAHTLHYEQPLQNRFYEPKEGNPYVLMGVAAALDAPGEWLYDTGQVKLFPPDRADPRTLDIEARRRAVCIDLSGRKFIEVKGLAFRAGTLRTNADSADLVLDGLRGEYLGHSYLNDVSGSGAVRIDGRHHTVVNCQFAHSSGSVLWISGSDHRIVNNLVGGGDYAGKWNGTVKLTGRRQYFAWNTVRDSGRDLVSTAGLSASLVEHNDLSNAGWLTHDLGMTYGHNTDFGNTVIRFNHVHDNQAGRTAMGIYFDHCSHNVIVYGNCVWNVGMDPIRINNPAHFNIVAHNSCLQTGKTRTFDHSHRDDMRNCLWIDNLVNQPIELPDSVTVAGNVVEAKPGYAAAPADFRLKEGDQAIGAAAWPELVGPDAGAIPFGAKPFRVGHDFANPPAVPDTWTLPRVPYMNALVNACFELNSIEGWEAVGEGVEVAKGNGWGNNYADRAKQFEPTGTSHFELHLKGQSGVRQTVTGLTTGKEHTAYAWLRVSAEGDKVELEVAGQRVAVDSTTWTRVAVPFTPGPDGKATLTVRKTTGGDGFAAVDNLGVPRVP